MSAQDAFFAVGQQKVRLVFNSRLFKTIVNRGVYPRAHPRLASRRMKHQTSTLAVLMAPSGFTCPNPTASSYILIINLLDPFLLATIFVPMIRLFFAIFICRISERILCVLPATLVYQPFPCRQQSIYSTVRQPLICFILSILSALRHGASRHPCSFRCFNREALLS